MMLTKPKRAKLKRTEKQIMKAQTSTTRSHTHGPTRCDSLPLLRHSLNEFMLVLSDPYFLFHIIFSFSSFFKLFFGEYGCLCAAKPFHLVELTASHRVPPRRAAHFKLHGCRSAVAVSSEKAQRSWCCLHPAAGYVRAHRHGGLTLPYLSLLWQQNKCRNGRVAVAVPFEFPHE